MILRMSDYPRTLLEFLSLFPDEIVCARHIESIRRPEGFQCPYCGQIGEPWRQKAKPLVLECILFSYQVSPSAVSVMHRKRQPLHVWFWAAYLVTTQTLWRSALQFQCQLDYSGFNGDIIVKTQINSIRYIIFNQKSDRA